MSSEEETLLPSIDELIQRLPTYSSSDEQAGALLFSHDCLFCLYKTQRAVLCECSIVDFLRMRLFVI